jgi:hypothetical protein
MLERIEGRYVFSANIGDKGRCEWFSYIKGYAVEQIEGNLLSQRDVAFKYGIKYVPIKNVELRIEPPLLRYHYGKGKSYDMGLGDSDIGVKVGLIKGIAGYAFVRVPTGSAEMPLNDAWAPKFSNNKWGGGGKLFFTQPLIKGMAMHLNIGVLQNIGDLVSKDNLIPERRIPLGLKFSFPYGIFVEAQTDVNRYQETEEGVSITQNPKRVVIGINYNWKKFEGTKLLLALEHGTWGTGDPPIHRWSYGWTEDVKQWCVTTGISYPIGTKPKVVPGIIEGRITEEITGTPIVAKITFKKLKIMAITDENGNYRISVPPGRYVACVKIPGYKESIQEAEVCEKRPRKLNIILIPD